jgi:ATP-dependent protease ClpP protease subunit
MNYNLVISGTIGSLWGSCSSDYVRYVLNNNKDKDVHVGFCSLGGFVKDGLEINQAFKDHGNVHAHAFGMNASIATIAMLGCKTIDIVKGSFFLIHNVSTWIDKYEQNNKEQLDNYIKQLQKQRDTMKTFDDVLASMYADKCKKTVDECLEQMKKGTWLTAQQAKDFGLVDEIREDKEAEDAADQFNNQFVNLYSNSKIFKDVGIPPLPSSQNSSIADKYGNPTHSFLQKTWLGLQNLFLNNQANNQKNNMIKIFASVQALLACEGFTPLDDGTIALTQEQLKKIEDQLTNQKKTLGENGSAMKAAAEAVKKLKDEKAKLEDDVKSRDEQIKNLQNGPGEKITDKPVDGGSEAITSMDLFNLVKDV